MSAPAPKYQKTKQVLQKRKLKFNQENLPIKKKAKTYRSNYGLKGAAATVDKYSSFLGTDAMSLVLQTLDPEENSKSVIRWPNQIGGTSVLTSKTVFDAEFGANDFISSTVVHPYLTNSITSTTSAQVTVTASNINQTANAPYPTTQSIKPHAFQEMKSSKNEEIYFNAPMLLGADTVLYPANRVAEGNSSTIETIYWLGMSLSADEMAVYDATRATAANLTAFVQSIKVICNSAFDNSVIVGKVTLYNSAGASVSEISGPLQVGGTTYQFLTLTQMETLDNGGIQPVQAGARFFMFGISISLKAARPIYGLGSFTMYYNSRPTATGSNPQLWPYPVNGQSFAWSSLPYHNCHKVRSLTDAETIYQQAGQYCVISQSLLMTNMSSSDQNSGNIASCRMSGGKRIGGVGKKQSPDWYGFISSLGYNSFDGRLANGTYTWYLGKDENSYDFESVEGLTNDLQDENYMAGVAVGVQQSSMRIKVFSLVTFTSSNSVYEQQVAPYMKELPLLLQLLGLCNSSFENESHGRQITAHLKKYGRMVIDQAKRIVKDPNTYKTAAHYIKKYGPTVASGLAAII